MMILCINQSIYLSLLFVLNLALICNSLNLTILHNNDFHSHYEPINVYSSECKDSEECFGGIARTVTKVKELTKDNAENVLFLNAGDHFQGTIWYTFKKWEVVAKFVKLLNHDVMALGNHEFDDGVEGLIPFVQNVSENSEKNLPIISCNIETTGELKRLIKPSIVITRDNRKIALIGYITPDTTFLARPGSTVKFNDEIESIKKEIEKIKQNDNTINIFIAVGHSGFEKDKEIAAKIPELDIVVGGHTNTFLYTGAQPPSIEIPEGPYPLVFDHGVIGQTLVVQAFAYGKYLGKLDVVFDDKGIITQFGGNPILLDSSTLEDPDVSAQVNEMALEIDQQYSIQIGKSYVFLDATGCREKECNAGNLMTDAFVFYLMNQNSNRRQSWTSAPMALVNGGAVRNSMSIGNITMKDVVSTAPFGNNIGILKVNGSILWKILEHSTSQLKMGGFLQVSGIRYQFDSKQPIGQRLQSVRVRCADCLTPQYEDLVTAKMYAIVITEYLANGGDNYTMIDKSGFTQQQIIDFDVLSDYIKQTSPITVGVEDRILDKEKYSSSSFAIRSYFSIYSMLFAVYSYQTFN